MLAGRHRTVEREGQTVAVLPPPNVLSPALQPERKRLCIEPPVPPTWALPDLDAFELPPLTNGRTLRVVTWNVWFAPIDADERMAALFKEALAAAPDVICLQEVVPELAAHIRGCAVLRKVYSISDNDVGAYGCLLFVRWSLRATFCEVALPSHMGRSLLVATWTPPFTEGSVAVATVHLESLNSAPRRAKQLQVARDALQPHAHALLLGDFNFDSTQNFGDWCAIPPRPPRLSQGARRLENGVLADVMCDYLDVWPALRPAEAGHTFDGGSNPHVGDPHERMRYDRVMTRGVTPVEISMLGERPRGPSEGEVAAEGSEAGPVPSDHYGLCAILQL